MPKREKKKHQTAVKYTASFAGRLAAVTVSEHIPKSLLFLSLLEFSVELAERKKMRLEDVPAFLRGIHLLPAPKSGHTGKGANTTSSSDGSLSQSGRSDGDKTVEANMIRTRMANLSLGKVMEQAVKAVAGEVGNDDPTQSSSGNADVAEELEAVLGIQEGR